MSDVSWPEWEHVLSAAASQTQKIRLATSWKNGGDQSARESGSLTNGYTSERA